MIYAMLDLTAQVFYQLPVFPISGKSEDLGFMKIWEFKDHTGVIDNNLTYKEYITDMGTEKETKMLVNWTSFYIQALNCFIVAMIMIQTDIFNSTGYLKYVTQTDGSMDLLVSLAEIKSKAITYRENNYKIKKILAIQNRRVDLLSNVETIKE